MKKADYRHRYKQLRSSLTNAEKKGLDDILFLNLLKFDWSGIDYLHVFIPIDKFKEPDTFRFINYLRKNKPTIKVVLSKSDFEDNTMRNYLWDGNTLNLEMNQWGIFEPVHGVLVNESDIDAVIIPLLVADKSGNRIGYGKGFYDRFLSKCKPSVQKIGLSYFEPVELIEDVNLLDIPIDSLITPNATYNFIH